MIKLRKLIKISILAGIVFGNCKQANAQDPFFSQYYAAPLQLNAAFTGLIDGSQIGVNYRNEWPFIDQSFRTYVNYNAFYNQYFPKLKSGFGLELNSDDAGGGFIKTNKINASYGYKIPVNRNGHVIKGGLELGFGRMSYAWDKFIFGDQIDPIKGYQTGGGTIVSKESVPLNTTSQYIDVGAGILYFTPKFYTGVSVKHINSPDIRILQKTNGQGSSLAPRFSIHGGLEFELAGNSKKRAHLFSPSLVLVQQSSFYQINGGGQYQYDRFFTGIFFRHSRNSVDALIFSAGIKKDFWKFGYSFDFTLSKLSIVQGGSHEISLLFNFAKDPKKTSNVSDCFEAFR